MYPPLTEGFKNFIWNYETGKNDWRITGPEVVIFRIFSSQKR